MWGAVSFIDEFSCVIPFVFTRKRDVFVLFYFLLFFSFVLFFGPDEHSNALMIIQGKKERTSRGNVETIFELERIHVSSLDVTDRSLPPKKKSSLHSGNTNGHTRVNSDEEDQEEEQQAREVKLLLRIHTGSDKGKKRHMEKRKEERAKGCAFLKMLH